MESANAAGGGARPDPVGMAANGSKQLMYKLFDGHGATPDA